MDILKRLEAEAGKNRGDAPVTLDRWQSECLAAGLNRNQFWYTKDGLVKNGNIRITDGSVCCVGIGLGVGFQGLLYSPLNPPNAPTPVTPVGNVENPTPSNASNAPELFQNEKPSHAGDQ